MIVLLGALSRLDAGERLFTVGTYNVENYVEEAAGGRPAKTAESKAKVRESIRALRADVLALQEVGGPSVLLELRAALSAEGQDYPYWEHVSGWDTNIQVAVLSRFPIVARRPHTNESYLLRGRRFHVSRGFAEVDVQVDPAYTFTLLTAHLKSRRPSPLADEAEMREQEAALLRKFIDRRLSSNPRLNLVVLGDFNDVKDAPSTKTIVGSRAHALIDTRPAEMNGDSLPSQIPNFAPRNVTWTHYYGKEDTYSRIDYILISPGMAREWERSGTCVLALPNWGLASDHRPIIASFAATDR
ncbi:MAG: endonuclease/exonuclease/phosphatase family protein [Verrucomicrobiales bacterium]|nr:endonuclease/exonuclease/phosphatase family protein [Verrucomicrobiales bacterium]